MNPLIETANLWSGRFFDFAWPMLWQSSLLIAVLFALDFVLRRKVRAFVRYTLWLVVLVKLLVPPSLALPTGLGWWLRMSEPAPIRETQTKTFTVTYKDTVDVTPATTPTFVYAPPPPQLSARSWIMLGWAAIGVGLFIWMLFRWRQVERDVQLTAPMPVELSDLLEEARQLTGLRRIVRLRLTDQPMSPAVCGLFRPVILLPQTLAQQLPPIQLRAVLLHEMIHLRRGDVWVNCAQALLQIFYWWHPLLWLANARIRRVREEAVDDAVMFTLRDDAQAYAPTLIEVAKLAFNRPLASLGLVGILESRSALRQRIQRLINFHAPRKAGLTVLSLIGILVFSALAVPMGEAPRQPANSPALSSTSAELQTLTLKINPKVFIRNVKARSAEMLNLATTHWSDTLLDILRTEGVDCSPPRTIEIHTDSGELTTRNTPEALAVFKQVVEELNRPDGKRNGSFQSAGRKEVLIEAHFYKMSSADFDTLSLGQAENHLNRNASPFWTMRTDKFGEVKRHIKSLGGTPFSSPRIQTANGIAASLFIGDATNNISLQCLPFVSQDYVDLVTVASTTGKFSTHSTGDWPEFSGRSNCAVSVRAPVEFGGGVLFRAINQQIPPPNNLVILLGITDVPGKSANAVSPEQPRKLDTPNMPNRGTEKGVPVSIAANSVKYDLNSGQIVARGNAKVKGGDVTVNGEQLRYDTETGEITAEGTTPTNAAISSKLYTRTYKVEPNLFLQGLESVGVIITNRPQMLAGVTQFFSAAGVNLQPPKSVFYNDRGGMLLVRATVADLDIIESAVQALNVSPPQVNIRVKFVVIPEEAIQAFYNDWFSSVTNSSLEGSSWTGIITGSHLQKLMKHLKDRKDVTLIAGPEVTTLSGRQAQIQIVDMKTIVSAITTRETNGETTVTYQTQDKSFGPTLDVVPYVSADGYTIQMTVIPTITEFMGYDDPREFTTNYTNVPIKVELPLPHFRVRRITASANVLDGQTLVLGNFNDQLLVETTDGKEHSKPVTGEKKSQLFVFVTPTLIDPAGNRIHTEDEMPFANKGAPPQKK